MDEPKAAIALKYDVDEDKAPKILASGKGWVAEAIVQIAEANDVPVEQNPLLANSLTSVEIGTEIPGELYELVAEVLWFVHRLDVKWQEKVTAKALKNGGAA